MNEGMVIFLLISVIALILFVCIIYSEVRGILDTLQVHNELHKEQTESTSIVLDTITKQQKVVNDHEERLETYEKGVHDALQSISKNDLIQ